MTNGTPDSDLVLRMPATDHEATTITVPSKAAKILLDLAIEQEQAKLRLDIAANMARAMENVPDDWELRAENGNVYFAAPGTVGNAGK